MAVDPTLQAIRHRLALLANSAEMLLNANHQQVRHTFRAEAKHVQDDIEEARKLLFDYST